MDSSEASLMNRRWPIALMIALNLVMTGCATTTNRPLFREHGEAGASGPVAWQTVTPDVPTLPAELTGPQPVDAFIRHALAENRMVRAARYNVLALKHRIPQVTSLDDPVISNTIFPIPAVAPQYSLMGYMPYDALLAQQFPWFGTLKLRGLAAEEDVKVALFELAAAQLDVVANVKRAYFDLYFSRRSEALLIENRALAEDFLRIARERFKTTTATQVDVLRAETAIADIDRELEANRQGISEASAELARLLHVGPDAELQALPEIPVAGVPDELDRLSRLAAASRPELRGRLAAIARDEKAVELARKRYYPNVTTGLVYQDMQKTNAVTPKTASGVPNVGLFVGFNLPIYRKRLDAAVCEAQARVSADAQLYEAERDQTARDVKNLLTQAKVQQNVLGLLRRTNLPNSKQVLKSTASDYRAGNLDYLSLITAWREVLQVELQIAQVETELGKALASLERAVGVDLNQNPPTPDVAPAPPMSPSPFVSPPR
jgi:cobalt-zinc-cadmium efflux system outer membrane protein